MGKNIYSTIKNLLLEHGPQSSTIFVKQVSKEAELSERNVRYKLEKLYVKDRVEWLKRHPEDWKRKGDVWYYHRGQEKFLEDKKGVIIKQRREKVGGKRKLEIEEKLDFTQLVEAWLSQPSCVSVINGIYSRDEDKVKLPHTGHLPGGVAHSPLLSAFKKKVEKLKEDYPDFFQNPFTEWEKFNDGAIPFIEKRKKIKEEITEIIFKEIGDKIRGGNRNIEISMKKLMGGILFRLYLGVVGSESNNFDAKWFEYFIKFNSRVHSFSESYRYYIRKLNSATSNSEDSFIDVPESGEPSKNYIFVACTQKDEQSMKSFKEEMDKKMEKMLRRIAVSTRIKKSLLELCKMEDELYKNLYSIFSSLTKIKSIK